MKTFLFTFYSYCYLDDFPSLHRDTICAKTLEDAYKMFIAANRSKHYIVAISDVTGIADNF